MFETGITAGFEFKFEFDRFLPVTGQTGPVNRNRAPAVRSKRSDKKTLGATQRTAGAWGMASSREMVAALGLEEKKTRIEHKVTSNN